MQFNGIGQRPRGIVVIQSIRYQVFVSSTFTDLIEERTEVLQAIWELDCIPTGMEAFVATNESQWEVIQKVIDECDYYVLIIGGRYGSVTPDGISYTEKEFNYAKKLGIPILAFVHGEPDNIPISKSEKDNSGRLKLDSFRNRVMDEHPIRKWTSAAELGGVVSRSISRAIKVDPRPGWTRNVGPSNFELLEQINILTKENQQLRSKVINENKFGISAEDLESGSDTVTLDGDAKVRKNGQTRYEAVAVNWSSIASWDDVFRDIGPILMNESTDSEIKRYLSRFIVWSTDIDHENSIISEQAVNPETYAEVIVQLRALGLIDRGTRKRAVSDRGSYWGLTDKGEHYLINLLARKKGATPAKLPSNAEDLV